MLDYEALFHEMYPGFFESQDIRGLPSGPVFEEMVLDLRAGAPERDAGGDVRFGFYAGGLDALRRAVRRVDETWPGLYTPESEIYCAFAGDAVASFCLIEDMGAHMGLRIGGPGCVGTVPEFRRRGIGLRMVANATRILADRGFDLSYIHYTGVAGWYAKLGYRTVLRWNRDGIVVPPRETV